MVLPIEFIPDDTTAKTGRKFDQEKLRYDLIPVHPLQELARTYTVGAIKYGDNNYLQGMKWGRIVAALMRHLEAWREGEEKDPKDQQLHLASVAWCAFTLMEYHYKGIGVDDRPCSR